MGFETLALFGHAEPFERARAVARYLRASVCYADAQGTPLDQATSDELHLRAVANALRLASSASILLQLGHGAAAVQVVDRAGDDNANRAGLSSSLLRAPALEVDTRGTRGEPNRPLTPGGANLRTRWSIFRWSEAPLENMELAPGVKLLGQGLLALPLFGGRRWVPESLIGPAPPFLPQRIADHALGRESLSECLARESAEEQEAEAMAGARRHAILP